MNADPILTLAWLAFAHLVADFVIQTEQIVADKGSSGRRAWRGLTLHGAGVAICLVPVALAFGAPGAVFVAIVSISHVVIDRTKVLWTRRAEARALARAHRTHEAEPLEPASSLGTAWTPIPGFLFAFDQLAHALVTLSAWAALLASAPLNAGFSDAVGRVVGAWDVAQVHRVVLTAVVLADLLVVNVRAGLLFVATLVHPRAVVTGHVGATPAERAEAAAAPRTGPPSASPGFTLRLGPFVATAEPMPPAPPAPVAARAAPPQHPVAPPAQVGAAVGVLERLIVVALVLTGASAAIGFVIAAKTLARFKQLDDRDFAEYYLLGTLASVTVALVSGLVASAALG